ncbi:hypothetical protein BGW39_000962 [Mortierella sp. 14UC]|nr:hypothetical protein BGW39_000962 [Mortierella sp. 14UC]
MDLPPPAALRKIVREVHAMVNDPPEGIRMILSEDISDIQAWIQGPEGTPFEGGCFRLRVQLNSDFPNTPPKCFFLTKIFHPNVSAQGDVCVSTLKKDWKKTLGLKNILLVVKCLLIVPNPESALNEEAGRLLLERYCDYAQRARLWTSIHALSAGKDIFTPLKRAGAVAQDGSRESGTPSSSSSSSSTIITGESDGNTSAANEATITTLAVKDVPRSGPECICIGDEQSSTSASSASSSSSFSSLSESNFMATTTTIPTKRRLGSAENRTEQESGQPSALRNQGQNLPQKQSANTNGITVSDQHNSQQQQEQQLPKDDLQQGVLNHNTNHLMLSPKMAHNTLLGATASAISSASATLGPEGSALGTVKIIATPKSTSITSTTTSSSVQHHLQSGLSGSCSNSFSLLQSHGSTSAGSISMLRSSSAPHNLSNLSHVRPELHVDKKRALRRL